ncbi:MAG: 5-amino-6-(5-phosphoribosylamino)uracil reductase / diaminohydroxyphosphoribosylaminopyrimidine [Verrucomicrobia bacterium]|nr:5-amino-6-(5-phosphoribosylamino)uracil reductase / diaminohydroxyphosphoribosylaminopyrimidine [Verrucomicrobiota bacterium]
MRETLRLARKATGATSPNPLVGAVLVKNGKMIGRGYHHRAGQPHAEIEALRDAEKRGADTTGATIYVSLEPCCTHGRTPPCSDAIIKAGIKHVIVAATDPNPAHAGRAFQLLRAAGIKVTEGILAAEATELNRVFNHWIIHRTPLITLKAAMTLDGKTATARGESKWITSEAARQFAMMLRAEHDAILVGVNTIIADDPSLTIRLAKGKAPDKLHGFRRIILDPQARTPLTAKVVTDEHKHLTTLVVSKTAPAKRIAALAKHVRIVTAPTNAAGLNLRGLMKKLGKEEITSLLVEGGGETVGKFAEQRLAHRIAFFYAPKVLGGRTARKGVAGIGANNWSEVIKLKNIKWRKLSPDLLLTADVAD